MKSFKTPNAEEKKKMESERLKRARESLVHCQDDFRFRYH